MTRLLCLVTALILFSGCSSFTSMVMNRDDHDNFRRNSNVPQKGVPITVNVPTHLKVRIEEEYYITKSGKHLYPEKPIRSVETGLDYEEKIFMVDLKRPAVGTIQTDIQIDPKTQYFQAIKGKVVDNTIREITDILGQFNIQFATPTKGNVDTTSLNSDFRTVAYARFDINSPDFELQLDQFLDTHINNCNNCQNCN